MHLPLFLLLSFVASSLACIASKEAQEQYTKNLRASASSTSGSISRLEKGRKTRQLSGIPKLKLDFCKGLIGSVSAIGHIVGNTVNCKEVLEKAARRKSRRKHRRRRPHKKPVEVSNFIEEPEDVVYYEESFPGEFDDGVVVDYEETPFDEQSFFSSSEKPDFKPTIPEFTSEKFYEDATTTEGGFGQSHIDHGHPLAHDSRSQHTQNHFHSDDAQDTTLQPFQHEISHDHSEEFTIKPFSHNSFNGVKWTPSSPDPNADAWTTSSPVGRLQSNSADNFVSWTTASPPSAKRVWTTFAPQRVTTKQAVAPAPTDQTQPLVGEFQVTSNPWPSQFTSDVLKQVGKLSAHKGASKTYFASPAPHTAREKKNVQPVSKFPNSFFASPAPNSAGETATEIAPFPKSFFASPTPENNRLKKEIEVSNYPKSFTNLGRQPSPNNHYAKPKKSFEKAQLGALNDGSAAFKESFFDSPQEDDIVDLLIPDPLSPGHPQGNGNHGWAPIEELAQAQRESFLKAGGSWNDPFKKSPKRQTHKKPLPVTTSKIQDWKKKSFVNTQAIKAQWESALQRELPDSRSESLDHSQERKWVQPAKKGDNEDTVSSWVKKPTQETSWQQSTTKPTSNWVKPTTKPVSLWESPTPNSQWEVQPTEKPTWTKSTVSPTAKWAADWVQPYSPVPKAWQKRELKSGAKTVSPTTTTTQQTPSTSISSIQEWAQTPLEKFAEIPSFESMRSTPRKTITLINKWQGPTTTTSAPRTVSYSPVTKPSAIRSFPETFPGTSRSTYESPYNTYESDADLSHLIGPTGAPGIAYIHTDAPKSYHPSPKTAQQLQQLGQINVNSNSHYMAQNPFLVNQQESPASTAHSNIFLGTPVPTVGSVKRNINQNDYWTYNPTTERSVVKTYSPFKNSIWDPPAVSEASNPKISVALPNVEPKSSKEEKEEEEELRPHETASKITGYSYKSVNFPDGGESEGYKSFHYTTS